MIDGEDLMDYDELLEGCESPIETHLLRRALSRTRSRCTKRDTGTIYNRLLRHAGDAPRFRLP